jgi:hypothetical protein
VGDYNRNGAVDASDYVDWRDTLGQSGVSPFGGADGDGDGAITQSDYDVWRANFGNAQSPASPASLLGPAIVSDVAARVGNLESAAIDPIAITALFDLALGEWARPSSGFKAKRAESSFSSTATRSEFTDTQQLLDLAAQVDSTIGRQQIRKEERSHARRAEYSGGTLDKLDDVFTELGNRAENLSVLPYSTLFAKL